MNSSNKLYDVCVCVCVYVCLCVSVRMCVCLYIHTPVYTCAYTLYMNICMHTGVPVT